MVKLMTLKTKTEEGSRGQSSLEQRRKWTNTADPKPIEKRKKQQQRWQNYLASRHNVFGWWGRGILGWIGGSTVLRRVKTPLLGGQILGLPKIVLPLSIGQSIGEKSRFTRDWTANWFGNLKHRRWSGWSSALKNSCYKDKKKFFFLNSPSS